MAKLQWAAMQASVLPTKQPCWASLRVKKARYKELAGAG
jgi:hypothetical protein